MKNKVVTWTLVVLGAVEMFLAWITCVEKTWPVATLAAAFAIIILVVAWFYFRHVFQCSPAKAAGVLKTPDSTEPIIAYRAWNLPANDPGMLYATFRGTKWTPRKAEAAKCEHGFNVFCPCGYYAFKTPSDLLQVLDSPVIGRVALWGRIVEHTGGYRAEFAYPQVLYTHESLPNNDRIKAAAETYGIETAPMPPELLAHFEARRELKRQAEYESSWSWAIQTELKVAALYPGGVLDLAAYAQKANEQRVALAQNGLLIPGVRING